MSMEPTRTVHVVIIGRVQGIGFRAWTHHQAELRGLDGWVRNRRQGSVEAVFSGPQSVVDAMIEACREGPAGAVVDRIEAAKTDDTMVPRPGSGFEVRATV
jgi:acylphosphatase